MSHKIIRQRAVLLFVITGLLAFLGFILSNPTIVGSPDVLCDWYRYNGELQCSSAYDRSVGRPLYWSMPYLLPTFFLLSIYPKGYKLWKKMTKWLATILLVFVVTSPAVVGGPLPGFFARDINAFLSAWLFSIISALVIAYSWWRQRPKGD